MLAVQIGSMVEMGHHHAGMHTCICTASTHYCDIGTEQRGECLLQLMLNRIAIGLYLPSVIACSIIL